MRPLGVGRFLFKFNAFADIRKQAKSDDANARLLQFTSENCKVKSNKTENNIINADYAA